MLQPFLESNCIYDKNAHFLTFPCISNAFFSTNRRKSYIFNHFSPNRSSAYILDIPFCFLELKDPQFSTNEKEAALRFISKVGQILTGMKQLTMYLSLELLCTWQAWQLENLNFLIFLSVIAFYFILNYICLANCLCTKKLGRDRE